MAAAEESVREDVDLGPGEEPGDEQAPATAKSGKKKLLIIGLGALLLLGLAGGAAFFLLGGSDEDAVVAEEVTGDKAARAKKPAKKNALPSAPAVYFELSPAFTVNYENAGRINYLQVTMQVMARDDAIIEEVRQHHPMIRNNLLLMLSELTFSDIRGRAAQEDLRKKCLKVVNDSLARETGGKKVESVYFTSFVME